MKTSESTCFQRLQTYFTNKMNPCIIFSTLLATVILLRILFIMVEMGYYISKYIWTDDVVPMTKQHLRGMHAGIMAYDRFEKIHDRVVMVAITGGNAHKFDLCYKDPKMTTTIEGMVREAFPDSLVQNLKNGTCNKYKISW